MQIRQQINNELYCTKCETWKHFTEFGKDKQAKSGRKSWCKECTSEDQKQRRQQDPETFRGYANRSYAKHKEKRLDSIKKRYVENSAAILERGRQHYEKNKESYRERHARYWKTASGQAVAARKESRRRSKFAHYRNDLTAGQWEFILTLADYHCLMCGCDLTTELNRDGTLPLNFATRDHVYSDDFGLIDGLTIRNIQPLCSPCNSKKKRKELLNTDFRPLEMRHAILDFIIDNRIYDEDEMADTEALLLTGKFTAANLRINFIDA